MSGSNDVPAPEGCILAQTDGVNLTPRLGEDHALADVLREFFSRQIGVLAEYAAADDSPGRDNWRVVGTTGDGLILMVNVYRDSAPATLKRYLEAILKIHLTMDEIGMPLRSVSHYCSYDRLISGASIDFLGIWKLHPYAEGKLRLDPNVLNDQIFGDELIKLSRLMMIAKGAFKALTEEFIHALIGYKDSMRHNKDSFIFNKLKDSEARLGCLIDPQPIKIPVMKGLSAISFETPCSLWELRKTAGE